MDKLIISHIFKEVDRAVREYPRVGLTARLFATPMFPTDPIREYWEWTVYGGGATTEVFRRGRSQVNAPIVNGQSKKTIHYPFGTINAVEVDEQAQKIIKASMATGFVPNFDNIQKDIQNAIDSHYKKENRVFFLGESSVGMKGLLTFSDTVDGETYAVTKEDVADGGTGAGLAKKYWWNKSGDEIRKDIIKAAGTIKSKKINGEIVYNPRTLLVPSMLQLKLSEPYSKNYNSVSIEQYLIEGKAVDRIIYCSELDLEYTTGQLTDTGGNPTDCFVLLDNSPMTISIGLMQEPMAKPEFGETTNVGVYNIPIIAKHGGCILNHPRAVYVGTAIGNGTIPG